MKTNNMDITEQTTNTYNLVSRGSLIGDIEKTEVIDRLRKKFSISVIQAEKLFKPDIVIKKDLTSTDAKKYVASFTKIGLLVVAVDNVTASVNKTHKESNTKSKDIDEDITSVLNSNTPRVDVSLNYKLGLLLVIITSAIAPLIYLSIIIGLIIGIVAYSTVLPDIISETKFMTMKIGYAVVPPFILSILLLFLLKPLFAKHRQKRSYTLKRDQAPKLFVLVETMCKTIGAPVPSRICIDNQVNASASATRGLSSLIHGDLTLTIGLPLLTGMNIRQFTGVMAHEFGHFAQKTAMTTYYIVNKINYWFYNRAYESDSWDETLMRWSDKADWNLVGSASVHGARLGIYITQKIFGWLFLANHKTTQFMSRNMEYDADEYESIFSGSEQFKETTIQLRKLTYAEETIHKINHNAWDNDKLLKNLPLAISTLAASFDKDMDAQISEDMKNSVTNAWASHPADNDRIEHIIKRKDNGIIKSYYPAHHLFDDIQKLCEIITLNTYTNNGIRDAKKYLTDNNEIIETDQERNNAQLALGTFFNNNYTGRYLELSNPIDTEKIPQTTQAIIDRLRESMVEYSDLNNKHEDLSQKYSVMTGGETYFNHNIFEDLTPFYLSSTETDQIRSEINQVRKSIYEVEQTLRTTDQLFFLRIQHDSKLMTPEQIETLNDALQILKQIKNLSDSLFTLKHYSIVLAGLLAQEDEEDAKLIEKSVDRYSQYCVEEGKSLLTLSKSINYRKDGVNTLHDSIRTWCTAIPEQHNPDTPYASLEFAQTINNAIYYHYYWALASVCDLCISVETSNNITQIKVI